MDRARRPMVAALAIVAALALGLAFVPSVRVVVAVPGEKVSLRLPATVLESRSYSSAVTVGATGHLDAAAAETRVRFSYSYSAPFLFGPKAVGSSVETVPEGTVLRLCAQADGDVFSDPDACRGDVVEFRTTGAARVGVRPPPTCPTSSTSCPADPAEVRAVASTPGMAGNLGPFAVADGSYGAATVVYSDGSTGVFPITAFVVLPVDGGRDAAPVITEADLTHAREEASDVPDGVFRTRWPDHRVAGVRARVELIQLGSGPVEPGTPGPITVDARVQASLIGYPESELEGAIAGASPGNQPVAVEVVDWRRDAEVTDAIQATATLAAVSPAEVARLLRGRSPDAAQRRLRAIGARLVRTRPELPVLPVRLHVQLVPAA